MNLCCSRSAGDSWVPAVLDVAGIVGEQLDQAERNSQRCFVAVAFGCVRGEGCGSDAEPVAGCADDRHCLLECEAAGDRLVGDAGRELGSEGVEVDVQVDLACAEREVVEGGDDVAVWVSVAPFDHLDGGVFEARALGLGERSRTPNMAIVSSASGVLSPICAQ